MLLFCFISQQTIQADEYLWIVWNRLWMNIELQLSIMLWILVYDAESSVDFGSREQRETKRKRYLPNKVCKTSLRILRKCINFLMAWIIVHSASIVLRTTCDCCFDEICQRCRDSVKRAHFSENVSPSSSSSASSIVVSVSHQLQLHTPVERRISWVVVWCESILSEFSNLHSAKSLNCPFVTHREGLSEQETGMSRKAISFFHAD